MNVEISAICLCELRTRKAEINAVGFVTGVEMNDTSDVSLL